MARGASQLHSRGVKGVRAAATHIANTTTIDGWRKSDAKKVPPEVVGAVVGKLALHKCCLDVLLEGEVTKAIERSGVKAIGQPALVGGRGARFRRQVPNFTAKFPAPRTSRLERRESSASQI